MPHAPRDSLLHWGQDLVDTVRQANTREQVLVHAFHVPQDPTAARIIAAVALRAPQVHTNPVLVR